MNGKKGSIEVNKIAIIVLTFFVMILILMWVQGNFTTVSSSTTTIGRNVSSSNTSVINMINAWNLTG